MKTIKIIFDNREEIINDVVEFSFGVNYLFVVYQGSTSKCCYFHKTITIKSVLLERSDSWKPVLIPKRVK